MRWQIVIHYGKNASAAEETVKKIESLGVKAVRNDSGGDSTGESSL
jgi:hypothetical protein